MSLTEISLNIPTEHVANVFGQFDAYIKKIELLVVKAGHIYLSERGKDVANYVMAQFLRD